MDRFRKSFSDFFSPVVLALTVICFLIMNDTGTTAALCWLAVVFSVSFFMRPFIPGKSMKYPDAGFGICFGAGLFLCFFTTWTVCAVFGLEYGRLPAYVCVATFAVAGILIRLFGSREPYVTYPEFKKFLGGFTLFAVVFLFWFWVIGFNPLVDPGTENYMDFGFMQTIYRQKAAVPDDIWFAGTKLNYYYLGQSASVFMCLLSGTTPEFGYNMMLATFSGMVFVMVYELVYALSSALIGRNCRAPQTFAGLISAAFAAFGANPHWILYGIIEPAASRLFGTESAYWFSDPTTYISIDLGDLDNGKNEFPAYSVILGDLHAHVINLIFVLPLIAILFDHVLTKKDEKNRLSGIYSLTLISMLLGYYKGANYWDFAIYFVITGAVIVFTDIHRSGFRIGTFVQILIKAVYVTAVSFVVIIPFTLGFIKMESGVGICDTHSPLFKLAVLWLPAFVISTGLLICINSKYGKSIFEGGPIRSAVNALILCTMGLVITPEAVYVKDIYGQGNQRFNTMFKLTYQAFILFAIITGIALAVSVWRASTERGMIFPAVSAALLTFFCVVSVGYCKEAVSDWYGDVTDAGRRRGISSLAGLYDDSVYGFEMTAADCLMEDDRKNVNIIEAAGNSYTHESALSVYSGTCTPVGWYVHEWMWHNDPDPVKERADEVAYFYCAGDEGFCRQYIKDHNIDYVFVGPAEVCKYPVNRNGFWRLGDVCTETIWQDCDLALIKIDPSKL